MSNIGELVSKDQEDELSYLSGVIKTLDFKAEIRIERRTASENPSAPTHSVYCRSADGSFEIVGAAWAKTMERGPNAGAEFLSVSMDDPSFPYPLNFAVFPNGTGQWTATWRRRRTAA